MLIVITKDGCHKMGENNPPSPFTIFLETSREVALEALLCRGGEAKETFYGVALEALLCRNEETYTDLPRGRFGSTFV